MNKIPKGTSNQTILTSKAVERQKKLEEWKKQKESQLRSTYPSKQVHIPLNITTPLPSKLKQIKTSTSSSLQSQNKENVNNNLPSKQIDIKRNLESTTGTQTENSMEMEAQQVINQDTLIKILQDTIENQVLEIQSLHSELDLSQKSLNEVKKVEEVTQLRCRSNKKKTKELSEPKVDDKQHDYVKEIKFLKFLLKQSIFLRQEKENECEVQAKRIDLLESRLTQLLYEHELPMNESNEKQDLLSLLPDREKKIKELEKEVKKQKEAVNSLRFSNELLIQRMAEQRGKFTSIIQEAYRAKKQVEKEQKEDAEAWNQLMYNMTQQMEQQMTQGLKASLEKIERLTKELQAERSISRQLKEQLEDLSVEQETSDLLETQTNQL